MTKLFFFRICRVFLGLGLIVFLPFAGQSSVRGASSSPALLKVFIDPGHGGSDRGAVHAGLSEAELVLKVGLRLQKLLDEDPNVQTQMSRQREKFLSLPE
ncbi:MAG: N-acetylmuramoyl-L-alanine amidase, partial [Bdellovibrio sp.]